MKNLFKSFLILSAIAMAIPCIAQTPNTLTKKEKKAGWELLFNGKDFSGWRQCNGTAMPANWVIEDNAMKVFTGEGKKPGQGANGDILYQNKKFKNFPGFTEGISKEGYIGLQDHGYPIWFRNIKIRELK